MEECTEERRGNTNVRAMDLSNSVKDNWKYSVPLCTLLNATFTEKKARGLLPFFLQPPPLLLTP